MLRGYLHAHASRVSFMQRLLDIGIIVALYCALLAWSDSQLDAARVAAVVLAVVLFALLAEVRGMYRSWRIGSLGEEIRTLASTWSLVVFALLALTFSTKTSAIFSRAMMLSWFVAVPFALAGVRMLARALLRRARSRGANIRAVAVVGDNPLGHHLIEHLMSMPWAGLVVKGVFDPGRAEPGSVRVGAVDYPSASIEAMLRQARAGEIDAVYLALPLRDEQLIESLVDRLADTTASVYVVPDLFVSGLLYSRWLDFGGMPMVSVYETPFFGLHGWVKRLEDIVLSVLILTLAAPLMLLIALAVKLSSPGPVLFKQRRYGLNGMVVEVWKFRSMYVCQDGDHVPQAVPGDARITPLGGFLRKTSLDELPQFFNVLQGSMSVVGPRPHAVSHNEQYRKLIKGYMLRHKVKPGITGWAQINGLRGETDTLDKMRKRIEYDLDYIQNWSLWLDMKILFRTLAGEFLTGR